MSLRILGISSSNRPFSSCFLSLYKNDCTCETIKSNSFSLVFSNERFYRKTRFETVATGNSEVD